MLSTMLHNFQTAGTKQEKKLNPFDSYIAEQNPEDQLSSVTVVLCQTITLGKGSKQLNMSTANCRKRL